jgi:hypothetical protein
MPDRPSSFSEIAGSMYPNLSKEARAKEAQAAKDKAWGEQDRQNLLRHLRELNARLRADRERRR